MEKYDEIHVCFSGYMHPSMKQWTRTHQPNTWRRYLWGNLGQMFTKRVHGEFGSHGLHAGVSCFVLNQI